ncbi:hypothetical protein Ancab_015872 [Ancistrocladus abbreviatus]
MLLGCKKRTIMIGRSSWRIVKKMLALFLELVAIVFTFMIKPLPMLEPLVIISFRSGWIVIYTWMQLVRAILRLHMDICWRFIIGTASIISLPARALSALHSEKLMERHLQEMQIELENLVWDCKELEARLKIAVKEHHLMQSMLDELEDEHDKAITKLEQLEVEVQRLKAENLGLRENQGKGFCEIGYGQTTGIPDMHDKLSSWKLSDNRSNIAIEDLLAQKGAPETRAGNKMATKPCALADPLTPLIFSSNVDPEEVLGQRKEVALQQSLFSALLSFLVGIVIWEAEDPCMPLVVALFTVVGMSLKSVVQFYSTIENKPASDAVALLSFNCFILGTLAYPTLPQVAQLLSPLVLRYVNQALRWTGLEFSY